MSTSYRDVFRSHRLLFLVPVVLAGGLALWSAVAAPKVYRSGATLWSDTAGSANSVFGALPPAGQDQQMLNELLTTRYFEATVARKSPLGAYLQAHVANGSGPAALLARLRGTSTVEERIAAALDAKHVISNAKGPHVLEVNYDAPTPTLAVATLNVILREFIKERGALRQGAIGAAQSQVASASKTLSEARTNLNLYLGDHPGSTRSDPELAALAVAERNAVTSLANATDTMNQATTAVLNGGSSQPTLRVVDPPQLPLGPSTGKKRLAKSLVGGLFAGAIVSMLGIYLIARRRRLRLAGSTEDVESPEEGNAVVSHLDETRLERVE